jgi:hypothetical protein
MQQKEKIGAPSEIQPKPLESTGPAIVAGEKVEAGKAPDIIRPRCMSESCIARRAAGELRLADKRPIGDPIKLWRLRYDFADGVVAEVLYCGDCRGVVNATIVGMDSEILKRLKRAAEAAAVPNPPMSEEERKKIEGAAHAGQPMPAPVPG